MSLGWSCVSRLLRYLRAANYGTSCGLAVLLAMPPSVTSSRASSVAASASVPVLFVCVCLVVRGPLNGVALLVPLSWFGYALKLVVVVTAAH